MLKMTEVLEATVKVTVKKTGKSYHRTMNYAKHVIKRSRLGQPKEEDVHTSYVKGIDGKRLLRKSLKKRLAQRL